MSSAKLKGKENGPAAVLATRVEHGHVHLAANFCERISTHERELIEKWNATEQNWSDDCCLHELLERQAVRTPDAPAVICGEAVLSYRELNARAQRVAACLIAQGVAAQEPIGIVADCSEHAIVSLLGVLKAGGAYLPLDKTLPEDRLRYFLNDAEVRFIVGQGDDGHWLSSASEDYRFIDLRSLPDIDDVCLPRVSPDQLAYVLYTSGSTGKAKGVMLDHRGPVNTIRDVNERFQIGYRDRVLSLSSLGFDLSVYDLFGMFAAGATVVQPTLAQSRDPAQWHRLINKHAVSIWNTVPALMDMLVTYSEAGVTYPSLRVVMLSGDWIPVSLPDRIRDVAPAAQIISLGGSTEASIWSVLYPIGRVDPEWRSIPYGSAMLNQRLYVVDSDLRLCPLGEVGELCLAGIGVAQGYLNRQELTAERFVPDPWDEGRLMYRTGDLCRYLPDGNLEFLGRRDHQVKIRGYRIGLGEIEAEIARLEVVREAAVIASEEGAGARLIAYVVLKPGCSLSFEQLSADLSRVLPEYMLPNALVQLNQLPLSANGKVDRRQLPLPTVQRSASELLLPRTPSETMVSSILCELLKLPQIDVRDDFYALGGHSLLAVALVCRIRQTCGVQLSVPEVMSQSLNTIELARLIDNSQPAQPAASEAGGLSDHSERLTRAPLSYSQQQLWVVHFLEQQRQRYNVPLIYDIQAPQETDAGLNEAALQFAFNELVQRHDVLRTVYVAHPSKLEQIVQPPADLKLEVTDLSKYRLENRESEFDRRALAFVNTQFDLNTDWPIRAALYQIERHHWRLVLSIHHIAIDGLSVNLIQREIAERYRAFLRGCTEPKAAISHQFANYAAWQHENMPPRSFDAERAYWREQLSGPLPILNLPHDKPEANATEGETLYFHLDKEIYESVVQFSRDNQVTPFITLLSAINAVFHRYTGQDDIVIASAVSTRSEQITQEMIGYFINVLPLRTRLDGNEGFSSLSTRVRETVLGALAHRQYPLELLKKELLPPETAGQDPFRVMFVLEDEPEPLQLAGLTCRAKPIDTHTAKFDLLIAAFVSADRIRFELQYRKACFHRERIAAFARHLSAWLNAAIAQPEQPINRIHWLPDSDHACLRGPSVKVAPSFLQTFANQVAKTPTSTAIKLDANAIDYAELDRRSDALASYLQERGIGSGDRVGIHLPRSIEMVIAVLAVLKTGAAYVPIDSAWPVQRRERVVQDCQPALLLTHSCLSDQWQSADIPIVALDVNSSAHSVETSRYRPVQIDCDSLAYVLYTSGSTGQPKGVAMRHGALDNLIDWQLSTSTSGVGDKTLQFASLGFDVSFQEIFATLCSGGQLILVTEELQQDLNRVWKTIVSQKISRLFVPFVALRGLAEIASNHASDAALREVITAGEQLQITPAVRNFFVRLPGCRLWNQYGPTETHVVTARLLEETAAEWPASPTIGLPIRNCVVALLDEHMQPVPRGIQGELYLGGHCLAAGYFGNEPLTGQRFIDAPSVNGTNQGLYRTGDIGFVNWQGELQFIGRNDHQVKVRGHRVELGEIELALAQCAGIQQAVVSVHNCGAGTQLRAHVLTSDRQIDIGSITAQLSDTLPAYMIPQQFHVVDHFPTTATGKVDRQRLAELVIEQIKPVSSGSGDAIDDPIVARLKPIWESVLEIESLDADASFFDCGGDSLAAAILFSRIEAEFGKPISIDALVKSPTLRQLADVIRERAADKSAGWQKLVSLQPKGTQSPIICLAGIDGHFLNFRHMASLFGDDRPMFGLQPVGLNGVDEPLTDILEMAADHVQTLRAAMPRGPYNLVGFSFGGIVAYEMAQILRRQGEQVCLALIDCSTGLPQRASMVQSLAFHVRYARSLPRNRRWQYWLERANGYWLGIKFKLKLISWEQRLEGLIDVKGSYSRVAAVNMQALARYRPTSAIGAAVLYRASLRANWPGKDRTDPAEAWSPLFAQGQFQVIDLAGAHASILHRPNVDTLVEHLRTILF